MSAPDRHVFLEGPRVYLRALETRDLEGPWFQWLNDPEVCRHNGHAIFPNNEHKMRAYFDHTQTTQSEVVLAVIVKEGDLHVGNVALQRIDWVDRCAELSILIGDRRFWGVGVSTEACRLLVQYGFERLGLEKIQCGTSDANLGMQKLAAKLGMQLEGRRRSAMYKNGRRHDILEYGVLRLEFQARDSDAAGQVPR